ncbi:MAG: glycerate kinase [Chloroflexota bacterium]|nr:glycerate kinase [Chloroflexota bacterium]
MRIIIAPQSLKGSLTAAEAGRAIAQGVRAVYPEAELDIVPIADGGEGTVQALVDATSGRMVEQVVTGPLGEPVTAFFGILGDEQLEKVEGDRINQANGGSGGDGGSGKKRKTAVIEMASCAGLPLVPPDKRDPRITTTYGVGELILAALEEGCTHFIIGIGGSATNDGGAGMAQALGASLVTDDGQEIGRGGAALASLARISTEGLDPRLQFCTVQVACDVTNPLCGPTGSSAVYGPQKGATPAMVQQLDHALSHYADILERDLGSTVRDTPGAGAAGGLGAGLITFLHATLRPGTEIILEAVHLEECLRSADFVITAEGQLDYQTAYGKSVGAVAALAKHYALPVLALAGSLGENYQTIYDLGVDAVAVLPSGPMPLAYAMEHAAQLTSDTTERAMRMLQMGNQIQHL